MKNVLLSSLFFAFLFVSFLPFVSAQTVSLCGGPSDPGYLCDTASRHHPDCITEQNLHGECLIGPSCCECVCADFGGGGPPSCTVPNACVGRSSGDTFCHQDNVYACEPNTQDCISLVLQDSCTSDCSETTTTETIQTGYSIPDGAVCVSGNPGSGEISCSINTCEGLDRCGCAGQSEPETPCSGSGTEGCLWDGDVGECLPEDFASGFTTGRITATPTTTTVTSSSAQCLAEPEGTFTFGNPICTIGHSSANCQGSVSWEGSGGAQAQWQLSDGVWQDFSSGDDIWVPHGSPSSSSNRQFRFVDGSEVPIGVTANGYGVCDSSAGLEWDGSSCRCPSNADWDGVECVVEPEGTFTFGNPICTIGHSSANCQGSVSWEGSGGAQAQWQRSDGVWQDFSSGDDIWVPHGSPSSSSNRQFRFVDGSEVPIGVTANGYGVCDSSAGLEWDGSSCRCPEGTAWADGQCRVVGVCGSAARTYSVSETSFGSHTLCETGQGTPDPQNPAFPSPDNSEIWTCQAAGGNSGTCTATRTACPSDAPHYQSGACHDCLQHTDCENNEFCSDSNECVVIQSSLSGLTCELTPYTGSNTGSGVCEPVITWDSNVPSSTLYVEASSSTISYTSSPVTNIGWVRYSQHDTSWPREVYISAPGRSYIEEGEMFATCPDGYPYYSSSNPTNRCVECLTDGHCPGAECYNNGCRDCVEITRARASDNNPFVGDTIQVFCEANPSDHTYIDDTLSSDSGVSCDFVHWNGDEAVFDCTVTSEGTKTFTCGVKTNERCPIGSDRTVQVTVQSSECSAQGNATACDSIGNCEWCSGPSCEDGKYLANAGSCVTQGSCGTRACNINECEGSTTSTPARCGTGGFSDTCTSLGYDGGSFSDCSDTCMPNTGTCYNECGGSLPSNTVTGGSELTGELTPGSPSKNWTYKESGSLEVCDFRCISGYDWESGSCVLNTPDPVGSFEQDSFTCDLAIGGSSCSAQISYWVENDPASIAVEIQTGTNTWVPINDCSSSPCFSTARHSNYNVDHPWPRTIRLVLDGDVKHTATLEATCNTGVISSNGVCESDSSNDPDGNLYIDNCLITEEDESSCSSPVTFNTWGDIEPAVRVIRGTNPSGPTAATTSGGQVTVSLSEGEVPLRLRHGCDSSGCSSDLSIPNSFRAVCDSDAGLISDGSVCVIDTSACGPPCTPGETRCVGEMVQQCQSVGACTEWVDDPPICLYGCSGGECNDAPDVYSFTVDNCDIELWGSECDSSASWTSSDVSQTKLYQEGTLLETFSGEGLASDDVTLVRGTNNFSVQYDDLADNPAGEVTTTATATCGTNRWDGSRCVECTQNTHCPDQACHEGSCIDPEMDLSVTVAVTPVTQDGSVAACNPQIAVTCESTPSGLGTTASLDDSNLCSGFDPWSCQEGFSYEANCVFNNDNYEDAASLGFTVDTINGNVSGVVTYGVTSGMFTQGDTASDAFVRLWNVAGDVDENMTTGGDGVFSFEDITPGTYLLSAEVEGLDVTVKEISLSCDGVRTEELELYPLMCSDDCTSGGGRCNYACVGEGDCALDTAFFEEYLEDNDMTYDTVDSLVEDLELYCTGAAPGDRRAIPGNEGHYFVCCGSQVGQPGKPLMYYEPLPAEVTSDARHLVQFTRLVSYYGMPVRMNVVVVD